MPALSLTQVGPVGSCRRDPEDGKNEEGQQHGGDEDHFDVEIGHTVQVEGVPHFVLVTF